MMRRYYGKRFYRVAWILPATGERVYSSFDDRRSEARDYAKQLLRTRYARQVTLEAIDDQYPANVLESQVFEREV